ncbi:polymorphic toxin-type HINT domain-containing protein [Streptomyces sp. NPDC089919]|uniref:polymorphic toxin-type HINT domain-containing protein n=1 Tax=Streptomyces sp. NPDC089919 TaxID=3155188 RepID=UPI00341F55CC
MSHRRLWARTPLVGVLSLALSVPASFVPLAVAAELPGVSKAPKYEAAKLRPTDDDAPARRVAAELATVNKAQEARARADQKSAWPGPSTSTRDLSSPPPAGSLVDVRAVRAQKAGGQAAPAAAGSATVRVLDQLAARRAGVTGVLITAAATNPGSAQIGVNYGSFASAVGGAWSTRLKLVALPACAVATPQKAECRTTTPLASSNDVKAHRLTSSVTLPAASGERTANTAPAVFAVMATDVTSPKGAGDYSATPLSASASWEAGGSSGGFTWSYPITVPPAAAGPTPSLAVSYSSASIDGRTASTNNQGTIVGEGFDLTSSYIERKYGSCDDDGHDKKYDLCWKYDNASLVLNGKASELVKDESDTTGKTWRLKNDDATKVFHETGAANDDEGDTETNAGDKAGEYWRVVTGDGTVYTFGRNRLPGAPTGSETNSVWTVPVSGDDEGEPGYKKGSTYTSRMVKQAWRWNVDLVQDTRGNAASYWYAAEENNYARGGDKDKLLLYTRGGYLKEIKYGQRADALFTGVTSGRVLLGYGQRCDSNCSSLNEDTAKNWPDVPFDAICSKSETDCKAGSPAFFTRLRLENIKTQVWSTAKATDGFVDVDGYDFSSRFWDPGDIGDSADQSLTLTSIQRTGLNGSDLKVPPVVFDYGAKDAATDQPNRVEVKGDDILPLNRPRIHGIISETGAKTKVTLSQPECVRTTKMPADEDDNTDPTRPCYPVKWNINGAVGTSLDWFHKYRVTGVTTVDEPTGSEVVTTYAYDKPGWHFNTDPITPEKDRTWSDWRGYGRVTTYTGLAGDARTKSTRVYMQGMHGDKLKDKTTTRTNKIAAIDLDGDATAVTIPDWDDLDQYAGFLREEVTYNGSTPISATLNSPMSRLTASQQKSYADIKAYYVRTARSYAYTLLTAAPPAPGTWRRSHTDYSYDDYGMTYRVASAGDSAKSGDETCTTTWYARNDALGLTSLVSRTRTVSEPCTDEDGKAVTDDQLSLPSSTSSRGDVMSDTAVVYDDATVTGWKNGRVPTKGLPTWAGRAKAYPAVTNGTAPRTPSEGDGWQTVSTTAYDALGRPTAATDAQGNTTTTAYTPATVGPLTATVVSGPKLDATGKTHQSYSFIDPARGSVVKSYDANLKQTVNGYDALGRITGTWFSNRSQAGGETPSIKYEYSPFVPGKAPWTSVTRLKYDNVSYRRPVYSLFDTLLRPLQTQREAADGDGRILTDTKYDTRGAAFESYADALDSENKPNGQYQAVDGHGAYPMTHTNFDGAGRPVSTELWVKEEKKWTTTTSYTGDSVATSAPDGGTASRTFTDALGRTTETRTYASEQPEGSYTSVRYGLARDGKPLSVTGPDGAKWAYSYDLFGRQRTSDDPDKGTSTTYYTSLDQISSTVDARGTTLLYAYDEMGRKTGLWKSSRTDANKLAAWTYDTVLLGTPGASIRYEGGVDGKAYRKEVTEYDYLSRPLTTELKLPADDPFVTSGAIKATTSYETNLWEDGTINSTSEPAAGGLPAETISTDYDTHLLPNQLSGTTGYVQNIGYTALGQIDSMKLSRSGALGVKDVDISNTYEMGTGRLTRSQVADLTHGLLQNTSYDYDDAGNVKSIFDRATANGAVEPDYQCFTYDGQRRLSQAWTPDTASCATSGRTAANLGGAAPYWKEYTYTDAGQRESETTRTSTGTTKRQYCYENARPHALVSTTTGPVCINIPQYVYDDAGNTVERVASPTNDATQTLDWNSENKLSKLTEGTDTTTYLYDADGELLIRRNVGGEAILYAGATEVHLQGSKKWANRSYSIAGQRVAVRSNESGSSKVSFLAGDQHGTSSVSVDSGDSQTLSKRFLTPFGALRGNSLGTWPDDKRFLGKPADTNTNLTHIGAREYDPYIGQFISVDPLLTVDSHQSLNGYSYANNNPTTFSDPTGLFCDGCNSGKGWSRPDGGTDVDTDGDGDYEDDGGGFNDDGTIRSTGGKGGAKPGTRLHDLGFGASGPLPEDLARKWLMSGYPSEAQMRATNGESYEHLSPELNLELYYREQCTGATTAMGTCRKIRDYYDGWAHVKGIDTVQKCPLCDNIGFKALMLYVGSRVGGCTKCFPAGTKVLLGDGSSKKIEEIKVGDLVTATDPINGKTAKRRVTALIITEADKKFNTLTLKTKHGTERLTATHEHPFWSPSEADWIPARVLKPGMTLLTDDGTTVAVTSNTQYTQHARTYNLTVDDLHTYYVLAGETPVLVHNSDCPKYENPGHHDPTGGPNPYVPKKAVLPGDAEEQFGRSVLVDGTRWTKIGSGKNAEYYRYFDDGNGNWHWSGSTNGVTKSGTPVPIPMSRVPIEVKRG